MLQPVCDCLGSVVIKAHAVDEGKIFWQAKQTRFWISGLCQWSDGADFDMTESECFQFAQILGIFIEAGGQPHRVKKPDAPQQQGLFSWCKYFF